jgi:glycosyltransferase involved in cell wall biosynthesis
MNILLQHVRGGLYFCGGHVWSADLDKAFDFLNPRCLREFVASHHLRHVQMVVRLDDLEQMEVVPLQAPGEVAPCLTVVMPAFNEGASIATILKRVLAQGPVQEVVVVDDGSRDNTWDVLQTFAGNSRVKLFRHNRNQGKGAALRTGITHASAPYVVIQDADLEYNPEEYHVLLAPALAGLAAVVFGSRFSGGGAHRVLYFWHSVGNRIITTISNMATDLNLSDVETGYKLFRREVLQQVTIEENRFGFEPEIVAKVSKLKVPIYEVPISYCGRTYSEGKKIGWRDGFSALRCILKYNLFTSRPAAAGARKGWRPQPAFSSPSPAAAQNTLAARFFEGLLRAVLRR